MSSPVLVTGATGTVGRPGVDPHRPALTYDQVARILGDELGRPVRYRRPGMPRYVRPARGTLGMPAGMVRPRDPIEETA